MKIVIDIEEAIYKECIPYKDTPIISNLANYNSEIVHAVANGTPIPKGHGKLIDADVLRKDLIANEWITDDDGGGLEDILDNSPTIVEVERSDEE